MSSHDETILTTQGKMESIVSNQELDESHARLIQELWAREDVKEIFERRNEFGLQVESAAP